MAIGPAPNPSMLKKYRASGYVAEERRQHLKIERRQGLQRVFALVDMEPCHPCLHNPRSSHGSPFHFFACFSYMRWYASVLRTSGHLRCISLQQMQLNYARVRSKSESSHDCFEGLKCKANVIHQGQANTSIDGFRFGVALHGRKGLLIRLYVVFLDSRWQRFSGWSLCQ